MKTLACCVCVVVALATGAAAGAQEPAAGKAAEPSARAISLRVAYRPLEEVGRTISQRSGLDITVDRDIADWKATVAWNGPALPLLRALCAEFALTLDTPDRAGNGTPTGKTYRLRLSDEERSRLDAYYRDKERREREHRERDAKMLADQIRKLLARVDQIPDNPPGPGGNSPLLNGAKPILQLIGSLGSGAIQQLSQSTEHDNTSPVDKSPSLSVPTSGLTPAQNRLLLGFLRREQQGLISEGAGPVADLLGDGLRRMDGASLGFWTDNSSGAQLLFMSVHFPGMTWAPDFPIVGEESSSAAEIDAARKKAKEKGKDAPSKVAPEEERKATMTLEQADYGRAALAVAEAADVNVVADAFTLGERIIAFPKDAPLSDVLDRLAQTFRLKRRWADGTLLLRREHWEDLLREEPPATFLDGLAERMKREGGVLSLADLGWVASQLTRRQLVGFARWHDGPYLNMLGVAGQLMSHYGLYSWIGTLSASQVAALQTHGLTVGSLDLRPRTALEQLAAGRGMANVTPALRLTAELQQGVYPPHVALQMRAPDGALVGQIE